MADEEDQTDETSSTSVADTINDVDISEKEFRYNPPPHNANLFARVDFGNVGSLDLSRTYDEVSAPKGYTEEWANKNLTSLRLGRLIQHHLAPGYVSLMKYRWGFRFLYNPTSVTVVSSRNDSFVIDGRSETNRVLSGVNQNFQTLSFQILLDRVPDVMALSINKGDYSPSISEEDMAGLRRFGTHWDLEALFKMCNGDWELEDRGKTSNIGILIPSNSRLILGQESLYGFVESVSYQDMLFSQDMVPMRTQVGITFRRHVDMSPDQVSETFPGFGTIGTGEETDDGGGGAGDDGGGGGSGTSGAGGDTTITDKKIPSDYRKKYITPGPQRTVSEAWQVANSYVGKSKYQGECARFVTSIVYGNPSGSIGAQYAYMLWGNCPSHLRNPGDYNPPIGAIPVWNNHMGGGAGHVAISAGGGQMISTTDGKIRKMDLYKNHYYGWIPPVFYGSNRKRP